MKLIQSLYIHFPYCRHLCNYCDFYKHKLDSIESVVQYENYLSKQIKLHDEYIEKNGFELNNLKSIYLGGGTPSLWGLRGPEFLKNSLLKNRLLQDDCEFTLEVDPGVWTEEEVNSWGSLGVNRFSVGIQSFDKNHLKYLDREHSMEEAHELLSFLKDKDKNYSVDLMIGSPNSKNENRDIELEINKLIEYNPNHFSVYILKTRSNYKLKKNLPDDDYISDEYLKVCKILEENGYFQYEVSNFAKPGFESFHNKEYWKYNSVSALGANATGLLIHSFDHATRFQWKAKSQGYTEENLFETSLEIERIYMLLRMKNGLKLNYFKDQNFTLFKQLVEKWDKNGYLVGFKDGIQLSAQGYLLMDSLMDDIFRELSL